MKKKLTLLSSAIVLVLVLTTMKSGVTNSGLHNSYNAKYKTAILESISKLNNVDEEYDFKLGITSHHLPTASDFIARFYSALVKANPEVERVYIIGPDHIESCRDFVTVTDRSYSTIFGRLDVDSKMVKKITEAGATLEPDCIEKEHSIGAQVDFVKYFYPDAKLVAITLSASTKMDEMMPIINEIADNFDESVLIVSVDLNHYRDRDIANLIDAETVSLLQKLRSGLFKVEHVDSPSSLDFAINFALKMNYKNPVVLEKANSADFGGAMSNTTGYVNMAFTP